MSTPAVQSRYEKMVAAALFLAMLFAGWGPFIPIIRSLPYVDLFMVPVTMALGVFAIGLLYDAAERLLGTGRGIYAAAVICSFPAAALAATDPTRLSTAGLMLLQSLGIWQATRARGDDRPFFLAMMAALALVAGYLYSVSSVVLVFAFWLAAREGKPRPVYFYVAPMLLIGMLAHEVAPLGEYIPRLWTRADGSVWSAALPWLPWGLAVLPVWAGMVRKGTALISWWLCAAGLAAVMIVVAGVTQLSFSAAAAAIAPMLALLAADLSSEQFIDSATPPRRSLLVLAPIVTAIALMLLPFASALGWSGAPQAALWQIVVSPILAALLLWTALHKLPRWSFVGLFAAGILLGLYAAWRAPILDAPGAEPTSLTLPIIMTASLAAIWIAAHLWWRREHAQVEQEREGQFLYAGENFRLFRENSSGDAVALGQSIPPSYNFAIFGDVTGAESLFATRRGGYFYFRALVQALGASSAQFAISLGDMAAQASPAAYRRVRGLLKQIPLPLVVTPGNHDLFSQNEYNSAFYHALYGADNAAFRFGPVKFVMLNNAWGSIDAEQFAWLERELREDAPFKLFFCHKPPFDFRPDQFYAMEERPHAERLHNLLQTNHVTAAFSGHIHSLLCEKKDGITYVISGGGGSKLTSKEDRYHYLFAEVTDEDLVIRAQPLTLGKAGSTEPLLELQFKARA